MPTDFVPGALADSGLQTAASVVSSLNHQFPNALRRGGNIPCKDCAAAGKIKWQLIYQISW
ncbi:MAG: hypothetical protein P1U87_03155 [Verrucomicrobiales bacterium]|nr:hypothetical protein [Verrucomicrobiales bacterium]